MRVLLATDGSADADQARDLVAGLPWPGGSAIDVVHVIQLPAVAVGSLGMVIGPTENLDLTTAMEEEGRRMLEQTATRVAAPGRHVHTHLLAGRPAQALADLARERHMDLIVTGHRGRSGLAQVLLGSVASEVVDRSPVPVLVARGDTVEDVLLAVDGTPVSEAAVDVVERWAVLRDRRVRVLSVADPTYPWWVGVDWMADAAVDAWAAAVDVSRASHARVTEATVGRLRDAGVDAQAVAGEGRPAEVILAQADAAPTDLIVIGSRGQTGLRRMVLGSVGRDVLHHASCSVLIARQRDSQDGS